jgi:hypothetical protein
MVNLQCSFIETFECFINGWVYRYPKWFIRKIEDNVTAKYIEPKKDVNGFQIFSCFFKRFKEFKINNGGDFYKNVRCALLHETQTKGNWVIRVTEKDTKKCDKEDIDKYIIYRNNFQDQLKELLDEYQDCLIKNEDFREIKAKDLRENFIAKMDHICNQS